MKKLGKLQISPEKIMKNKELISLKGGGDELGCCICYADGGSTCLGGMAAWDAATCTQYCNEAWDPPYSGAFGRWTC